MIHTFNVVRFLLTRWILFQFVRVLQTLYQKNVELRENLIMNGLKNVKRFQPEVIAEKYAALYRKTVNNVIFEEVNNEYL